MVMDSLVLYNQNGQKFDVEVIRYFSIGLNNYLIFSLNEVDNSGYIQLYLSRVEEVDGKYVMLNVTDEEEWNNFKNAIQQIVANNKRNVPNETDLDYAVLNESTVSEFRIFKLKTEVANTLAMNKKDFKPQMDLQSASAKDTGLSIEEMLRQVSEGAKSAREVAKEEKPKKKLTIEDLLNKAKVNDTVEKVEEPKEEKAPVADSYMEKYNEAMEVIENLKKENINLLNELAEAKAKLRTIKDVFEKED